jgi:catechol 2,3-dioxygenase-like lactoylglutathione lyase family enzyme
MQIKVTSIMVDDQEKALAFYTNVLGFLKKTEVPLGEHKWLTVVSPEAPDEVELLLEPMGFEPARIYQKALYDAGIPATMFNVNNLDAEYARLLGLGVTFSITPRAMGPVRVAVFADTCGNWLQIVEL